MKNSRTAYVILGMLSIEPNKSGYDIRKAIESSVGYFWRESYGQIYPALKRLTAEGLIRSDQPNKRDSAARHRQKYSLTAAGRAEFQRWLALPFHNDPPRNEFLLKLFFGREADPGVTAAHVRALNDRNRIILATMLSNIEN
jgi:DNA-binding PadR family transcriptional regulator